MRPLWLWPLRVTIAYILGFALLALVVSLFGGAGDWSEVGGAGNVVVSFVFWSVIILPALAFIGFVLGLAVWCAVRIAPSSSWLPGIAAATVVAGLYALAIMLIGSLAGSAGWDALVAIGISLVVGVITARDVRAQRRRTAKQTQST